MRRVGSWIGVWALAAAMAPGCNVFNPDLLPPGEDTDNGEQDSGPATDPTGCTDGSKEPPPPPPQDTEGPDIEEKIIFALKDVVLSDQSAGLNIDGLCTGPQGPWSCLPAPDLDAYLQGETITPPIDGPQGLDSQFAKEIFSLVNSVFSLEGQDLEITSQVAEAHGYGNPLIEITNYNGTANDPRVRITVTQSVFAVPSDTGEAPDVCVVDTEEGGQPYEWLPDRSGCDLESPFGDLWVDVEEDEDGNQIAILETHPDWETGNLWFWGREDTFVDGNESNPIVDIDNAYVSDWTLVARLPDNQVFNLVGQGQAVQARLHGTYAVAHLRPDLTGSEPGEVLVAGRWGVNALMQTAESVGVCADDPSTAFLYHRAKDLLDADADVRTRAEDEGEDVPCNALSFGITFTAHRGNWGGIAKGQPIPDVCGEDEEEEAGDEEPVAER